MIKKSYRPDIDRLRGIAVFSVVAYHIGLPFFTGGFVGVDIFFVISGYLICRIIHREIEEGGFSFKEFYARRVKRILPALFAVLLFCYIVGTLILTVAELRDFSRSAVANILGVSNIYFWKSSDYFSTAAEFKPLMMTWSLSVEEQFYLFFPIALLVIKRFRLPLITILSVLTVLSFAASIVITFKRPPVAFFLLPTRAWELGAGALLAIYESRRVMSDYFLTKKLDNVLGLAGLVLLIAPVFMYTLNTPFPGSAAALPVLGAVMCIAARNSVTNRLVLSWRPIVWVGLVSYSWYLWHWPLLSFSRLVSDRPLSLQITLTLGAASFVIALASWKWIEQPFRTSRLDATEILWRYAGMIILMVGIGSLMILGKGLPQRLPATFVVIEQNSENHPDPCLAGYGQSSSDTTSVCIADGAKPGVALIGDSHAAALAPAIRQIADKSQLGYYQLTKSSCPTFAGVSRFMPNHPTHYEECKSYNDKALKLVTTDPAIKIVVLAGYWFAPINEASSGQKYALASQSDGKISPAQNESNLQFGLANTVQALIASGKQVIVFKDVPMFDFDPVRSVASSLIPARKLIAHLLSGSSSDNGYSATLKHLSNKADISRVDIDNLAEKIPALKVIDPWQKMCDSTRCTFGDTRNLYYFDSQHVSTQGAKVATSNLVLNH